MEPIQQGGFPGGLITESDANLILNILKNPNIKKKGATANITVSYDLDELIVKIKSFGYNDIDKINRIELQAIFSAVDTDSSGRIEENELPLFIIKLNEKLQAEGRNIVADTFAAKLLQMDKDLQAAKLASQQTPPSDDEVNLNTQSLGFNRFLDDVLKLNRKSQGKLLGNGIASPLTMTNIEGTSYYTDLRKFFDAIVGTGDTIEYADYLSALRLIDQGLLKYLNEKGTGSAKCDDAPLIAQRATTSNDSILDQILAQENLSHFRDLPYNKYKNVMDKLKIEIDRKTEPPAQATGIKLKPGSTSTQTPQTVQVANTVKQALKSGKIPNMITGNSIEELFKKISKGDGQIDAAELVTFMKEYNPNLNFTLENAQLLIKSLDVDGDGTLGIIEFASLIGKQNPSNDVIEQYRQLYEGLKDGKPSLDKATFTALLKKNNSQDAAVIDDLVAKADLNKDGNIEFDEFLNLMMEESTDSTKTGGNNSREFISKRDSMDYVISRNESLRDRVRLIGKYKPSNLKKK